MKLDALDHPKTFDFAARLKVKRVAALGHLELLWAFTGKQAPQGNIGKWPNGAIARACDWEDDPKDFVAALIESGFVDTDTEHRLVIHDWHEHAQSWVRAKLKNLQLTFIKTSTPTTEPTSTGTRGPTSAPTSEPSPRARVPSEAKGREGKSSDKKPPTPLQGADCAKARPERKARDVRAASLDAWDRSTKTIDKIPGTPLTWEDAKRLINDPDAHGSILAIGGYKAVADRTEFTQGELKRRFREHYEQTLENPRESQGENSANEPPNGQGAKQLQGLIGDSAKGMQ